MVSMLYYKCIYAWKICRCMFRKYFKHHVVTMVDQKQICLDLGMHMTLRGLAAWIPYMASSSSFLPLKRRVCLPDPVWGYQSDISSWTGSLGGGGSESRSLQEMVGREGRAVEKGEFRVTRGVWLGGEEGRQMRGRWNGRRREWGREGRGRKNGRGKEKVKKEGEGIKEGKEKVAL